MDAPTSTPWATTLEATGELEEATRVAKEALAVIAKQPKPDAKLEASLEALLTRLKQALERH